MPPEQCKGHETDARSDIYALGVVMFRMLTGTVPFAAATLPALLRSIIRDPAPSLRQYSTRISADLEAAIHKMLAKNPGDRFSSCHEVAQVLATLNAIADLSDSDADSTVVLSPTHSTTEPESTLVFPTGAIPNFSSPVPEFDATPFSATASRLRTRESGQNASSPLRTMVFACTGTMLLCVAGLAAYHLTEGNFRGRQKPIAGGLRIEAADLVFPVGTRWTWLLEDGSTMTAEIVDEIASAGTTFYAREVSINGNPQWYDYMVIEVGRWAIYDEIDRESPIYEIPLPLEAGHTWTYQRVISRNRYPETANAEIGAIVSVGDAEYEGVLNLDLGFIDAIRVRTSVTGSPENERQHIVWIAPKYGIVKERNVIPGLQGFVDAELIDFSTSKFLDSNGSNP